MEEHAIFKQDRIIQPAWPVGHTYPTSTLAPSGLEWSCQVFRELAIRYRKRVVIGPRLHEYTAPKAGDIAFEVGTFQCYGLITRRSVISHPATVLGRRIEKESTIFNGATGVLHVQPASPQRCIVRKSTPPDGQEL